jgi:hypothetical protein
VSSTSWLTGDKPAHDGMPSSGAANFGIIDMSSDASKIRQSFRRAHAGGLFEMPGREADSATEAAAAMAMARGPAPSEQTDE